MNFRLSEEACSIIARVSHERRMTATAVVELALRQLDEVSRAKGQVTKPKSTVDTPEEAESYVKNVGLRRKIPKPDWKC